jgi:hypothetical protein
MGFGVNPPNDALTPAEKKLLAEDIYYLNMAELRSFCDAHAIPYMIHLEKPDGRVVQARDADRKGVVIGRILHFLRTGVIKPKTIFRKSVVASESPDYSPTQSDKVLFGHYKNHDQAILKLMKQLTAGEFDFGAIAQEVLRACWSRNHAPTYREFAELWQKAIAQHSEPNPEWAFLSDRRRSNTSSDWKRVRAPKAARVIAILEKIK